MSPVSTIAARAGVEIILKVLKVTKINIAMAFLFFINGYIAKLLSLMLKIYLTFILQISASFFTIPLHTYFDDKTTNRQKDRKNKKTFGQGFPKAGTSNFGNPAVIAFQL